MVVRAIFVLLSALAGMALFLRAQDPSREFLMVGLGMVTVTSTFRPIQRRALSTTIIVPSSK